MSKGIGFYGNDFFVIKSDAELVSESITRIIMTNIGERVSNPYFGVNLKNFLFDRVCSCESNCTCNGQCTCNEVCSCQFN